MNKSIFRDILILSAIGLLLLLGGYWAVLRIKKVDFSKTFNLELSQEYEEKLGQMIEESVLESGNGSEIVRNQKLDSALKIITTRLEGSIDSSVYDYKFIVLESNDINAFNIPGGRIFIFTGLIDFTDSPEQLAAVLAHEMGHAEHKHVVKKLVKSLSLSAIVAVLTGGDPSVFTSIMQSVLGNVFDRESEREADEFACQLMEKAGIDPIAMATFFHKLNEKELSYDRNLELLMTHPHNDSRIQFAKGYQLKKEFKPNAFDLDWTEIKNHLGNE